MILGILIREKETKTEEIVGKIVKIEKDGNIKEFVSFNDNIEFGTQEGKADVSNYGYLKNKEQLLADIDKAEADNKISEDAATKAREGAENTLFKVTLTPSKD